ncbi:MAG: tetratricopeptide repeat protein [Phycisphaerae bacterium]|jgi:tetratricopeptide (TPR) repeat protein
MAQRLNKNVVVGLTIAIMAATMLCGAVLIVMLPPRKPEPLIKQAEEDAAAGKYRPAMQLYLQAVERAKRAGYPNDEVQKLRILAGEMAQKAGRLVDAWNAWGAVLREDALNKPAQEHIVALYLEVYRQIGGMSEKDWETLEKEARKEQIKDTPLGLAAAGLAMVKQRSTNPANVETGRKLLEQACELSKDNPDFALYLADYHLQEARTGLSGPRPAEALAQVDEHLAAAERIYDRLKDNLPADPEKASTAWRYRGAFFTELRQLTWYRQQLAERGTLEAGREIELAKRSADADQKALEALQKALETGPKENPVLGAMNLCAMGDYWYTRPSARKEDGDKAADIQEHRSKAEQAYREAVLLAPDEFDAYDKLALIYRNQNRLEDAARVLEERLSRAIKLGTYLEFRNRLLMARFRQGAFDVRFAQAVDAEGPARAELIKKLEKLRQEYVNDAEIGTDDAIAKFMQAQLFVLQNRPREALQLAEEADKAAVPDDRTRMRIKLSLAQLYSTNGAPAEAERLLKSITEQEPGHEGAWTLRTVVQWNLGQLEPAMQSAQHVLQINPANQQALRIMAQIFRARGNHEQADRILKQIRGGELTEQDRQVGEAIALLRPPGAGESPTPANLEKCKELLRGVLKAEPDHLRALQTLVMVLATEVRTAPNMKDQNGQEIKRAVEAGLAAARAKKEKAPATAPAGVRTADYYQRLINSIELLAVHEHLGASPEELIKELEEVVSRQEPDPFQRALNLYSLFLRNNKFAEAIKQLQTAAQLQPDSAGVLTDLFNLALLEKQWAVAQDAMEKLIKLQQSPAAGRLLRGALAVEQAEAAFQEEKLTESRALAAKAREELEAGLRDLSKSPDSKVYLAQALGLLGDLDGAAKELREVLDMNPRHGRANLWMYRLCRIRGDEEGRKQYLAKLVELAPDDPMVQREAQELEDARDPHAGIRKREQYAVDNPEDAENLLALAKLYAKTGQEEKSRATFDRCLVLAPENLMVVGQYAAYLRDKTPPEPGAAAAMIQKAIQAMKEPALKATAQLLLAGHLEQMSRRGGPDAPSAQTVTAAYETALKIAETPPGLIDVANFYLRTSRPAEAETKLRRAIELTAHEDQRELNRQARRALIQILVSRGDRAADAEREIAEYQARFAADGWGNMALSDLSVAAGKLPEALEQVSAYLQKNPQSAAGWAKHAYLQYQLGAVQVAIDDLKKAIGLDPRAVDFDHRRLLAKCLMETGQAPLAITELQSILSEDRTVATAARQLIDVHLRLKQYAEAESVALPRSRDQSDPMRPAWLNLLSTIYTQMGNADKAVEAARQAVVLSGLRPEYVIAFADAALKLNRPREVIDLMTNQLSPQTAQILEVQARLGHAYALSGQREKALEVYASCLDKAADNYALYRTLIAGISQTLQKPAAAEFLSKRAADKPGDWGARYALALLETIGGQTPGSDKALDVLLAETTGVDETSRRRRLALLREMTGFSHENKDYAKACKLYEQYLELDPGNVLSRNNMAFLYLTELKEPQKALENAQRAVNLLTPSSPPLEQSIVIDTLGWCLVWTGDYTNGILQLRRAVNIGQAAGESFAYTMSGIYYHLAEGLYRRGQAGGTSAGTDRNEAALACQQGYRLLKKSQSPDPDGVGPLLQELAGKLGIALEEKAPPATQAVSQ